MEPPWTRLHGRFLATDESILSVESEFIQQKKPTGTTAVDAKEIDGNGESYTSRSTESSGQNYFARISFIACITTGSFLLILASMIVVLLAVHSSSNPSLTTVPCLHSLDPVSSLLLDKMGTSSQLLGNMYANVTNHLSGFIQDQLVKYANGSDHLSSLFRDRNGTNCLLLYCRRCFNSNSTSFFDNSTLTRALKCGLKAVLIGVGTFIIYGAMDCCMNMYQFVARYSNSLFSTTSSAGPRRNVSLPRFSFIVLLLTGPLPVVSGTVTTPNSTLTNELGFPFCVPSDEVIYEQCLPSEFEPKSDMCPVMTPQEVNYILPQLNRFVPMLVQMRTTEEGGGQIPGAPWGKPGNNVLPSSMSNNSALLLCFVMGVLGPVSPMFLIVCVYLAPAPRRFLLDLIATLRAAKMALLFISRCLRMVWDTGAMCLRVGVAKTTACLYCIVLFFRVVCWIVSKLVDYHIRSLCLVVEPPLAVLEVSSDSSTLHYPRTTSSLPYKESQDLPDDACYVYPTQSHEGAQRDDYLPRFGEGGEGSGIFHCLRMVWDTAAMYLNVGVAKTSACLYSIVLFYRFIFWSMKELLNHHMRKLLDDVCYPTQGAQRVEGFPVANVRPPISSSQSDQAPTLSVDEGDDIRDPTSSDQVPVLVGNSAGQTNQANPVSQVSFPPKLPHTQTEEENPSFPPANAEAVSEGSPPDQQDAQMVYDPINSTIPELAGKQVRVASSRGFPPTECGELRDDAMMSSVVHRASGTPDGLYCSEATLVEKGPVPAAKTPGKTVYRNYFPRRFGEGGEGSGRPETF